VLLQALHHGLELGEHLRERLLHGGGVSPISSRAARVSDCGVRMPATTSSPWALIRNSP
jgi:hypothetical protein